MMVKNINFNAMAALIPVLRNTFIFNLRSFVLLIAIITKYKVIVKRSVKSDRQTLILEQVSDLLHCSWSK